MTAPLTNEYSPLSLVVIGFAGGADCACAFSCTNTALTSVINAANAKDNLFFTRFLRGKSCHISESSTERPRAWFPDRHIRPAFLLPSEDRLSVFGFRLNLQTASNR